MRRWSKKRIAASVLLCLAAVVVALNWTWGRLPDEPQRTGRMAQVGDVELRVLERDPPGSRASAGPAVVLIHGLPGTADDFEDVVERLPGVRTIAYDRPGFGFSEPGYRDLDAQVATLADLLHQTGAPRPVLVGHSYGGTIALAFAARHPEAVGGLVLVDAAAGGVESSAAQRAQSRLVQALSLPVVQPLADVTFSQLLRTVSAKQGDARAFAPDEVDARHERRVLALSMQHDDLDAYADEQLAARDAIAALDRRLPSIATPAIVIQGDADEFVEPEHGRAIAAALPHARLVMVSGGHMPTYVHPGRVAAAVRTMRARAGAAAALEERGRGEERGEVRRPRGARPASSRARGA